MINFVDLLKLIYFLLTMKSNIVIFQVSFIFGSEKKRKDLYQKACIVIEKFLGEIVTHHEEERLRSEKQFQSTLVLN